MIEIASLRYLNLTIDSLTIPPGLTTVIGPNGGGKTSFLKICAGIALPERGTVRIDGLTPRESETGWVNEFPDRNILFARVADEISSPLRFSHRFSCREIEENVRACAGTLRISHLLGRTMHELSGGEKALISLAAAVISHPALLVLDEFDTHLDASRATEVGQMIREAGARYTIRCTHQMDIAAESDHLLYLDSGSVIHTGTPADVFSRLRGTAFYPLAWECGV